MDNQVTKLLQSMADKLGTTVIYLWHVLVHQAFINGIGNLIEYVFVSLFGIVLFKLHVRFSKDYGVYYELDEFASIPMTLCAIVFFILFITCLFSINDTINSFFNPEYWALNHILKSI